MNKTTVSLFAILLSLCVARTTYAQSAEGIITDTEKVIQDSGGLKSWMAQAWEKISQKVIPDAIPSDADPNLKMVNQNQTGAGATATDEQSAAKREGSNGEPNRNSGSPKGTDLENSFSKMHDVIAEKTGGVIQDLWIQATKGQLPPTIGRNVEIENSLVAIDSRYTTDGLILYGPPGAGKSVIANQLQREIIEGHSSRFPSTTRILKVAINKITSTKQFEEYLGMVMTAAKEGKLSGIENTKGTTPTQFIVLYDDVTKFAKPEPGRVANINTPSIEEFDATARQKLNDQKLFFIGEAPGGTDVKTGRSGDPELMKNAFPFMRNKGWRLQYIRELTPEEIHKALGQYVDDLSKTYNVEIDRDLVQWSDMQCRKYYPALAQPGCTAYLLYESLIRREKILQSGERVSLAEDLQQEIRSLEQKLAELKQLPGRYAKEKASKIPTEIAELQKKVDSIEQHSINLAAISTKMKTLNQLESTKTQLSSDWNIAYARVRNARKGQELEEAQKTLGALKTKIDDVDRKITEARQAQKSLQKLTTADMAIQIHRDNPGISYVEIFKKVKPQTFEERWANFQKEYAGAETYYRLVRDIDNSAERIRGTNAARSVTLILGPAGSGKTQFGVSYANAFKDGELIKVDGGDYQSEFQLTNFTSAPPGYAGYEEGSKVINSLRQNPNGVLLIDEPSRMNLAIRNNTLLNWFDGNGGLISDSKGRTASMKNIDVIMADNAGSDVLTPQSTRSQIDEYLIKNGYFSEPFLRRVQRIIVMPRFEGDARAGIIDLKLQTVVNEYDSRDIGVAFADRPKIAGFIGSKLSQSVNGSAVVDMIDTEIASKLRDAISSGRYMDDLGNFEAITVRRGDMIQAYIDPQAPDRGVLFRLLQ